MIISIVVMNLSNRRRQNIMSLRIIDRERTI